MKALIQIIENNLRTVLRVICFALTAALGTTASIAQEVILFPAASTSRNFTGSAPKENDNLLSGSLFFSQDIGRLRFLGEVLLSNREKEVERAQIGWKVAQDATIWAGRFHTPIGFWNTEFHHGAYLQTTIHRPQITNYEDENGLLPLHGMGALFQSKKTLGDSSLNVELSLASGPTLHHDGLEPIALLRKQRYGRTGGSAKIAWQPQTTSNTQFGASAGRFTLPYEDHFTDSISQTVVNGFVNWEHERWRALGEIYIIRNNALEGGIRSQSTIKSAYLQTEYRISDNLLGYFRVENTTAPLSDPLISRVPTVARHAATIGTRIELGKRLALKVEAFTSSRFDATTSHGLAAQISGVLK
jgi:hypothetical protein